MTEINMVEESQGTIILDIDCCPTVSAVIPNHYGNGNSNNYEIVSDILIGESEEIIDLFSNDIVLNDEQLSGFMRSFERLRYIYSLEDGSFIPEYSVVPKEFGSYPINRISISQFGLNYSPVMKIFTGGIDLTNGDSHTILSKTNLISLENVKTEYQARFFRDCLIQYFNIMGVGFSKDIN